MAEKTIERKIPGGKLVRLEVTFSHRIEHVKITGDFFLHPEEMLDILVNACIGLPIPFDADMLRKNLDLAMQSQDAQFVGVSIDDLISMLEEAVS